MSIIEETQRITTTVEVRQPGVQGPAGGGLGGSGITSVNGDTGPAVTITKSTIGLGNVDNTSDVSKPVSTAQASADTAIYNASKAYADGLVVGLLDDRGNYDASVNTFPATGGSGTAGAILKGDLWRISVAGTLGGTAVTIGDTLRALVDTPGQTAGNWATIEANLGFVPENSASKDATGGYAGLTGFSLRLKNAAGTITSLFASIATTARTWTMPDKDGTVAMTSDITGTNSGTNTGDETGARIGALLHAATAKTMPVDADEVTGLDSAASFGLIRVTWTSVKAFLKTYFDTLYQAPLVSGTNIKTINSSSILGSGNLSVSASPGGSDTYLQFNNAGAFDGNANATINTTTGAVTLGQTLTLNASLVTSVGTMTSSVANGAAAVGFNRNTANAFTTAGAVLDRVQNNGTTVFAVTNGGSASLGPAIVVPAGVLNSPGLSFGIANIANFGAAGFYATSFGLVYGGSSAAKLALTDTGFSLGTSGKILWSSSTPDTNTWDVALGRNSAGVLEVNSQTAGTFRDLKLRNLIATGNLALGIVAKTANYTVTANDHTIECDATSGAITLTLPAVSGAQAGTQYILKKTDASANAVTFDGNASETIDGATTVSTTTQWASITIRRNAAGTAWITTKD